MRLNLAILTFFPHNSEFISQFRPFFFSEFMNCNSIFFWKENSKNCKNCEKKMFNSIFIFYSVVEMCFHKNPLKNYFRQEKLT